VDAITSKCTPAYRRDPYNHHPGDNDQGDTVLFGPVRAFLIPPIKRKVNLPHAGVRSASYPPDVLNLPFPVIGLAYSTFGKKIPAAESMGGYSEA